LEVAACRAGLIVNEKKKQNTWFLLEKSTDTRDITCFTVNQYKFDTVTEFKYLGSNLTEKIKIK
jgi:hypothetical protein